MFTTRRTQTTFRFSQACPVASPTAVRATDVTKQARPETPMPSSVAIIVVPQERKDDM